jgi:hypothetical protein
MRQALDMGSLVPYGAFATKRHTTVASGTRLSRAPTETPERLLRFTKDHRTWSSRIQGAAIADLETGFSPGNLLHLTRCNAFWELRDLQFPENRINWDVESIFDHFYD